MKTAVALLAAALSVAALSTNASAQRLTANTGGVTGAKLSSSSVAERNGMNGVSLKDTGVVGFNPQPQPPGKSNSSALSMGTNYGDVMTRAENNVDYDIGSSAVLVKTYCSGYCVYDDHGADTSFGTRSVGGFKLASNKAELGTGAIGVIHPSYVPNPNKLWGLDEDSLTEGSAGEIDILSNTSIVLGDEAIGIIHPDYVPIDPEVPGEAIGVIHPDYVPIDPEEVPGEAMAYRLIASLIGGGRTVTETGEFHVEPAGVQEEWYDTGPFKLGSVTEEENPNDSPRPEKELIWLMGFPGSGADNIMDVVEQATGETGATKFGQSSKCVTAAKLVPCYTEFLRVKGNIPTEGFDTTPPDTTPPSPAPAIAYGLIAAMIEGDPDRPITTSMVAPTGETQGSNVATATEYDLIAALIAGTADPGGEGTYTTTTGEADAAKTFDYCVIYPERCTVSEIERPTFGPHILTFDD